MSLLYDGVAVQRYLAPVELKQSLDFSRDGVYLASGVLMMPCGFHSLGECLQAVLQLPYHRLNFSAVVK